MSVQYLHDPQNSTVVVTYYLENLFMSHKPAAIICLFNFETKMWSAKAYIGIKFIFIL